MKPAFISNPLNLLECTPTSCHRTSVLLFGIQHQHHNLHLCCSFYKHTHKTNAQYFHYNGVGLHSSFLSLRGVLETFWVVLIPLRYRCLVTFGSTLVVLSNDRSLGRVTHLYNSLFCDIRLQWRDGPLFDIVLLCKDATTIEQLNDMC